MMYANKKIEKRNKVPVFDLTKKPVKDVNAIVKAMQYFLNKPDMAIKFGKIARKRAITKFDSQKITAFWIKFYSQILKIL